MSALDWSIAAMCDATDGTLVRYHPETYDGVIDGQPPAERLLTEETLGGLRFVRNRMGHHVDHADFIHPGAGRPGPGDGGITSWTWKSVPRPPLASLPPRSRAWEMTRYRAYEAQLGGHPIGETFGPLRAAGR